MACKKKFMKLTHRIPLLHKCTLVMCEMNEKLTFIFPLGLVYSACSLNKYMSIYYKKMRTCWSLRSNLYVLLGL